MLTEMHEHFSLPCFFGIEVAAEVAAEVVNTAVEVVNSTAMEESSSKAMAESTCVPKAARYEFRHLDVRYAQQRIGLQHTCESAR